MPMQAVVKSSNPRPQGQGVTIWPGLRTRVRPVFHHHLPRTQLLSIGFFHPNAALALISGSTPRASSPKWKMRDGHPDAAPVSARKRWHGWFSRACCPSRTKCAHCSNYCRRRSAQPRPKAFVADVVGADSVARAQRCPSGRANGWASWLWQALEVPDVGQVIVGARHSLECEIRSSIQARGTSTPAGRAGAFFAPWLADPPAGRAERPASRPPAGCFAGQRPSGWCSGVPAVE